MLKDFQKFIARGNVLDMAVGIIIGAAFTTVVNSLVNDVIMPPIGLATGGVDFSNMFIDLSRSGVTSVAAAKEQGLATINYGMFLNAVVNFLIVAAAVFMLVRAVTKLMVKEVPVPAAATEMVCPHCRMLIPMGAKRCGHCTQAL
jgi:large conductance mechanosensitive channel